MQNKVFGFYRLFFLLFLLVGVPSEAQQHRATRLGNPATRFAPPLVTPEDLRARFRDEKLRVDMAAILHQWDWKGKLEDLYGAALTNEVTEVSIPVGARMPFMSSREQGKPVCLVDVLWAGSEPVKAYAFSFSSSGRRYRCVTPKPCSNFFLEDLGTDLAWVPAILVEVVDREDPVEVGGQVTYLITVTNQGHSPVTNLRLQCSVPDSQEYVSGTGITPVQAQDGSLTLGVLPTLAAQSVASWKVITKALKAGDSRFQVEFSSDHFQKPIHREEATQLY
jgi:uncharacterized repeat protein (TIGR01451 family)